MPLNKSLELHSAGDDHYDIIKLQKESDLGQYFIFTQILYTIFENILYLHIAFINIYSYKIYIHINTSIYVSLYVYIQLMILG